MSPTSPPSGPPQAQTTSTTRILLVGVTATLALCAVGLGVVMQRFKPAPTGSVMTLATAGRPSAGLDSAAHTVVVYSDFLCPHCQDFHLKEWSKLQAALPADTRVVFLNRVIFGAPSLLAATAAECAFDVSGQTAYNTVSTALYTRASTSRGNNGWITPAAMQAAAAEAGVPQDQFAACLGGKQAEKQVKTESANIARQGGNNTPGVLVDGTLLGRNSAKAILEALTERRTQVAPQ